MGVEQYIKDTRSPLAKLLDNAPVPHRVIEGFDGAGGRFRGAAVAVRALSGASTEEATAAAAKHLVSVGFNREDLYTEIGEGIFSFEIKVQILSRALVDGRDPAKPFADTVDQLRSALESDEVGALFEHYLAFQEERSPISSARSWEEVEGLLTAVGKGLAPASALSRFDASSLRFMLRELAALHWTPTRPPSSDTSPSIDSAPHSSAT